MLVLNLEVFLVGVGDVGERIAGLWTGRPLTAAVWEARAGLRRAEGQPGQADALLAEAADEYDRAGRPVDAKRCRQALLRAT